MTQEPGSRPQSFAQAHEYSSRSSGVMSSRRLRLLYFGAASVWGFVVGVAGLLVGLGFAGEASPPSLPAILGLIPAGGIAIAGAGIIAGAYGEAKRRRR